MTPTLQSVHMLSRDAPGRCSATKADGEPCGAIAQTGKDLCWHHDPENAKEVSRQRREAGRERSVQSKQTPHRLIRNVPETVDELIRVMGRTVEAVRLGQLDAHRAKAVGELVKIQHQLIIHRNKDKEPKIKAGQEKGMSDAELEEKLSAVEAME